MGQTATTEPETAPEIDAFRERVRELRSKLERAQGAKLDMPAPDMPAPVAASRPAVSRPQADALPAAIEQRMIEATQRIEHLAARETDLTNLLRRTRAELDASEREQESAAEALRIAEDRASAASEDTEQARAVADGLRQQVDAQRKRIEALGAENRALQERNDRIGRELSDTARRETAARDELKRLQNTFDALQQSYDEVRRQKADLESKLSRTSGRINEFETELMGQLQHLEAEYARIEGVAGEAKAKLEETEVARAALAEENEVKDALLAELRDELTVVNARRSEESEHRRTIDGRLEGLQAELAGLQSRYAADLVELDAARQAASRFEKRAADLTDELQAQRNMMQQHEMAFAQMDSLFRSLDGREAQSPMPRPVPAATVAAVQGAAPAAEASDQPRRPAPAPDRAAAPAPARVAPAARPVALPVQPQEVAATRPAAASGATVRPVARPAAAARPLVQTAAAAQPRPESARERLGKSLEALQALADKHKPTAEEARKPVAPKTDPAASQAKGTPAPRVARIARPTANALPDIEAVATPRPTVRAPAIETPAPASGTETRDGFIMPKPRLIRKD